MNPTEDKKVGGLRPIRHDHRDRDFHKSFGTAGYDTSTLPQELDLDAHLWMPNQMTGGTYAPTGAPNFTVPPMPDGCTDYAQTDLCIDEDGVLLDPTLIENIDHANASGGTDIRTSLEAAKQAFGRDAYYNIKAGGILDWFDALRVAMASTATEKRGISIGTPYYREWAGTGRDGIMPEPASYSNVQGLAWHNADIKGWKLISGVSHLKYKSWQGDSFGDGGWGYMSRVLVNNVMAEATALVGPSAFTLSKAIPQSQQTVNLTIVQWIVSFIRSLLHLS